MKAIQVGGHRNDSTISWALVDDQDYESLANFKWTLSTKGYAFRYIREGGKYQRIRMHRQVVDCPKGFQIDHKNLDKLNNCRSNLRVATHAQNIRNRYKERCNKSGFKGVYWHKHNKRWRAAIGTNGKDLHLGYYDTAAKAAIAYNTAASQTFGEFAQLNQI